MLNKVIAPALKGYNVFEQRKIDMKMLKLDGTPTKSKLGSLTNVTMVTFRERTRQKQQKSLVRTR